MASKMWDSMLVTVAWTDIVCSRALLSCGRPSQVDLACSARWDALVCLTVVLRWRMSCDGPVTAGRPPALVRPTPGACVPSLVQVSCLCQ